MQEITYTDAVIHEYKVGNGQFYRKITGIGRGV